MNRVEQEQGLLKLAGVVMGTIVVIAVIAYLAGAGPSLPKPGPDAAASVAPVAREAPPPEAAAVCVAAGSARPLPEGLAEASGVAASRATPDLFWTHNDSGEPVLHAVDLQGRPRGQVRLEGAAVQDWEDIAAGPCPAGGDCLYLADIGDNGRERPYVTVYRVPEPSADAGAAAAEPIRLRYPDGAHDAEAMFVLGGTIHLVTKGEGGPSRVYRAAPGRETMEVVRTLSEEELKRGDRITGASASADWRWVALRTLRGATVYPAEALLAPGDAEPRRIDLEPLGEQQGEGIAYTPDGSLVVTSEGGGKGRPGTIAPVGCPGR